MTFCHGVVDANLCEFVLAMLDEGNWSSAQEGMGPEILGAMQIVRRQYNDRYPERCDICREEVRNWKLKIATRRKQMLLDRQ